MPYFFIYQHAKICILQKKKKLSFEHIPNIFFIFGQLASLLVNCILVKKGVIAKNISQAQAFQSQKLLPRFYCVIKLSLKMLNYGNKTT